MAEVEMQCDVSQGFNFAQDNQVCSGHLMKLKIGDKQFAADLEVGNPLDVTKKVKVVAVLSGVSWEGGRGKAIKINGQISDKNKPNAAALMHSNLSNTEVKFQFDVFCYDKTAKKFYKCFHTNDAELSGLVAKVGDKLEIQVSDQEGLEVVSPTNYHFSLGVNPPAAAQDLQLAFSTDVKQAKTWGVAVG